MNTWVEFLRNSRNRSAMPIMTHPGIDLIGKTARDAVTDGEIQFRAIKAVQEAYPAAAALMMMDLSVEAEAFGSTILFGDAGTPGVAGRLLDTAGSIEELKVPSLGSGRIPQYLKVAALMVEAIRDKPVFACCIGPFSLAGRLFDLSELMTALYTEPDAIRLLLKKCSTFLLEYTRRMKALGADGIIMAEPAAGLLSSEMCDEFSSSYIRQIVGGVQDDEFLFILHNCGNRGQVTRSMVSTGAGALHFGNAINIVRILEELPADILIMGNLDPVGMFKMANPQEVYDTTSGLLRRTSDYRNFVISSGCDLPPGVPVKNVEAFFEAVNAFNRQKPAAVSTALYAH